MVTLSTKPSSTSSREISNLRRAMPQVLAVFIKNLTMFVYGNALGMPTLMIPDLSGNNPEEPIVLNQREISWIASLLHLCVPIGCLFSSITSKPLGRKRALQFCTVPFFIAFLILYFATEAWHILLGLCLLGIAGGLMEAPSLSYTAETTEANLRGALTSAAMFFLSLGIIFSFITGSFLPWRSVALVNSSLPVVTFILLLLIPESPYWLINRNRTEEAQKSLAWLRGWTTTSKVEKEFLEIEEDIHKNDEDESKGSFKLYTKSFFYKPFLLILLSFTISLFGVSPITIYSVEIYNLLQVPISSYYATVLNGCANLAGTVVCVLGVRFMGKRVLVFISLTGVCLCFCIAAIYTYIADIAYFEQTSTNSLATDHSWIPLVSLVLMGFFSYLMIYSLPWILAGEIYNNEVRDVGASLSAASGYIVEFIALRIFLGMVSLLTLPGVLWFYSGVALLGIILLYFLLPETEGKTLFDIWEHYSGGKKLDNKVLRNTPYT